MRRLSLTLTAVVLGSVGGCAQSMLAQRSSDELGCAPELIEISDPHGVGMFSQGGQQTWIAACNDTRWFCSVLNETVVCSDLPEGFELSE